MEVNNDYRKKRSENTCFDMDMLNVTTETENAGVFFAAKLACVSELELVWEVCIFVDLEVASLFKRFSAFTLKLLFISVERSHVDIEIGLGFVDFVAFVAPEGCAFLDVVVEVKFEDFCRSDELSARTFDSGKAIV